MGRRLGEVRERREAAGGADRPDRVDGPEALARHVAGHPVAQDPLERVLDARRVAGGDQRASDGGPAERVVTGQVERLDLRVDADAGVAQPFERREEPRPARRTLRGEGRLERLVVGVHLEPEDVQLATRDLEAEPARDGVDLDPRDELEASAGGADGRSSR